MEQLLHYVWKHKLFPLKPLHTTTGQKVEIIDPGLSNPDAGPDFFNAKIKLDGVYHVPDTVSMSHNRNHIYHKESLQSPAF